MSDPYGYDGSSVNPDAFSPNPQPPVAPEPPKRKHPLRFTGERGKLAMALGLSDAEMRPVENLVDQHIAANKSLKELLIAVGEIELTDECWANFLYTFGYWDGGRQ